MCWQLKSTRMTWLEADLHATDQEWIIAFWHHPPYTKGTHNSDNINDSSGRMQDMREIALPILESNRVDLVLSGHSHVYERSYCIRGHYGYSPSFDTNTMVVDGGDGREDGSDAYGAAAPTGTVYTVCGCSGARGSGSLNHPAMFASMSLNGSVVIDVEGKHLRARFLDDAGRIRDHFTIVHVDAREGNVDADSLPDWWERWHFDGLGQADDDDDDHDGVRNADELIAGTDPTNGLAYFVIQNIERSPDGSAVTLQWPGEPGRFYTLESSTNLTVPDGWRPATSNATAVRGPMTVLVPPESESFGAYRVNAALGGR